MPKCADRLSKMSKSPKTIHDKAYLYSLWSGKLKVYEGPIYGTEYSDTGTFKTKEKRFKCSNQEGVVANSVVWLSEKDDKRAKKILIEYWESGKAVLQERIDNYDKKIEVIKKNMETVQNNINAARESSGKWVEINKEEAITYLNDGKWILLTREEPGGIRQQLIKAPEQYIGSVTDFSMTDTFGVEYSKIFVWEE
jgi:hypothetical protein